MSTKAKPAPKKRTPKAPKAKKPAAEKQPLPAKLFAALNLDPVQLSRAAKRAVSTVAGRGGTGSEKHHKAVALLTERLDSLVHWPATPWGAVAEALDGPALRLIVGGLIRTAYASLKSDGKVL